MRDRATLGSRPAGQVRGEALTKKLALASGGALAVLMAAYLALAPSFHLLPAVQLYDAKRLLQLGLLLGIGSWLAASKWARASWMQALGTLPLLARFGLVAVAGLGMSSAMQAAVPRYAWMEFSHFVLLFAVTGTVAGASRQAPTVVRKAVAGTVVLGASLYVVTFFVGYGAHLADGRFSLWPDAFTGFANIRIFNHYQTWTLPLLVAAPALLGVRSPLARWALYSLPASWWMLLFASGARGATVAAVGAAVVVGILFRKAAWPWLKGQVAALCAGGALFFLFFKVLAATQSSLMERDLDDGRRFQAWKDALEMGIQSPLLGVGPMHYANYSAGSIWASPHSAPLQLVAEWGLLVALIAAGLVLWGLWSWITQSCRTAQTQSLQPSAARVAVTAALLAGAAHSLVSGIIVSPMSQLLGVVVIGWAWGLYTNQKPPVEETEAVSHRMVQIGLAAALAVLVWGCFQDAFRLQERRETYYENAEFSRMYPRYWQQGYFGLDEEARGTKEMRSSAGPLH